MISEKKLNEKIEELRVIENNISGFMAQKQVMQVEQNEINNALTELKNSGDEVYKVVSGIMIKSTKEKLSNELGEKMKVIEGNVGSVEKQEEILEKNSAKLRKELDSEISKKKT